MKAPFLKDELAEALLDWYSENKCQYPWRYTNDPFLVMVSEFFLQQTKSEDAVAPYNDVVGKYRNVLELADADILFLRGIFRKLGLVYRAERLVSAARFIMSEFGGEIPDSLEKLISIPGIGPYSANAVLCFGFGKKSGIADANIIRIYSRLFSMKFRTSRPRYDKGLWKLANDVLPEDRYADFNYALLDLGKLICTSKNPKCTICPLNEMCSYYSKGFTQRQ
jgi:A/G-specific adenine glycosylase